jgi:SAM-dependent methyltransferase
MTKKSTSIFWHASVEEHWRIYDSPARPSKGECQLIQSFISHLKKRPKILILGSTPESRDLAHNLQAEVTCVDGSLEMLTGMTELMKYKNKAAQEIWFRSNWLTMPVAENYYDFVLGDLVVTNLPLALQSVFLAKIKSVLKPGGYFITRDWWPPTTKPSVGPIIERVIKSGINKKSINLFTWEVLNLAYNSKKHSASTNDMYQVMRAVYQKEKNKTKKKQFSLLLKHLVYNYPLGKTWWVKTRQEAEKTMKKYFKIRYIKHGRDNKRANECPIYFLQK